MSKTKIAHIITGLNVGGAERSLHTLLQSRLNETFEHVVISLMDEGHYGKLIRENNIRIYCLGLKRGTLKASALYKLFRIIKQEKPNILQGWMYHGNLIASLVHPFTERTTRLFWNIRTSLDSKQDLSKSSRLVLKISKLTSRRVNTIIYNSDKSRRQHAEYGLPDHKAVTINNAFDTDFWRKSINTRARLRADLGYKHDDTIVGYVGRDNTMKDLPNLFGAMYTALIRDNTVKFLLIGRGIANKCPNNLKENNRVKILSERSDVNHLMSVIDIFILSSKAEGFPNVLGEAMATNVPCVSTDVGDAREIIGETGWTCVPSDSSALAIALLGALSEPPTKRSTRGAAARRRIKNYYSSNLAIEKYTDIYTETHRSK